MWTSFARDTDGEEMGGPLTLRDKGVVWRGDRFIGERGKGRVSIVLIVTEPPPHTHLCRSLTPFTRENFYITKKKKKNTQKKLVTRTSMRYVCRIERETRVELA